MYEADDDNIDFVEIVFSPSFSVFRNVMKHTGLCFMLYVFLLVTHLMFQIHRLLSKHFGSFLESKTFNKQGSKAASGGGSYIQIRMRARGPKQMRQNNNKGDSRYAQWSVCLSVDNQPASQAGRQRLTHMPNRHVKLLYSYSFNNADEVECTDLLLLNGSLFQTDRNWVHRICIM